MLIATPFLVDAVIDKQASYQFETGCLIFLDSAASSPTVTIAKQRLDDAIFRCEKFNVTQTQTENLQALKATLANVPASASPQEEYYLLRLLKDTLEGTF